MRKSPKSSSEFWQDFFYGHVTKREPCKIIENRTAWRIVIFHLAAPDKTGGQETGDGQLILAPFAKRVLKCEILKQFEYERWEKRGFIRTEDEPVPDPPVPFFSFVRYAAWTALALTALSGPVLWFYLPYWVALIASIFAVFRVERQPIFQWIAEALNLVLIVAISLALSSGFLFLFTRDPSSPTLLLTRVAVQAGIAVVFFVVIASSLPALLYYIFERQKSETLREFFLRDVIRLNPNLYTLDEADFRYGRLADEVYGRKSSQEFLGGLQVTLLVNLALTTLGWSLALMPNVGALPADILPYQAVPKLITPLAHPIVYGALGSYFFALNMLFRRYVRADLSAKAYTHVVVRQFVTVILVWVISVPTQLWINLGDAGRPVLLVTAFFVGIVPETALALLQDYLRNNKIITRRIPSLREDQPLDDLEGVSLYDRARLLEEGIENVENLAHHNMIDLMLRARMPTPRLADLVDQAVLYLHLHEPPKADGEQSEDTALATLRHYGIRTATDLEHACDLARKRSKVELNNILSLLDKDGEIPGRLQVVLDALEDDDWMPYLREWHRNQRPDQARTLEELEEFLAHPDPAKEGALSIAAAPLPPHTEPVTTAATPATAQAGAVVVTAPAVAMSMATATLPAAALPVPATPPLPAAETPVLAATKDAPAATA
jgi:hypothetical protein